MPEGSDPKLRDKALEKLVAAFGEPERIPVRGGTIYRWTLERQYGLHMYVTLDSPERPDLAHLIVSDPKSTAADPVVSIAMWTLPEVDAVIARLRKQWKG
jgi:hypothetical protein